MEFRERAVTYYRRDDKETLLRRSIIRTEPLSSTQETLMLAELVLAELARLPWHHHCCFMLFSAKRAAGL